MRSISQASTEPEVPASFDQAPSITPAAKIAPINRPTPNPDALGFRVHELRALGGLNRPGFVGGSNS